MPDIQLGRFGQHPAPSHIVAHLSDPHLLADGVRQYGVIDTEAGLRQMLRRLRQIQPPPRALVFTGDLADRAEPAAYARLRELVEPIAAEIGAQVVWVMGNHDDRAAYASALFDQTLEESGQRPQDRVYDVAGLRIISLDTSVPGYHHGEVDDSQLTWLGEILRTAAPHGTLLALHHPPIPLPMIPAAEIIELLDQDRLAGTLRGTDVIGILAGHLHFSTHSTFAGIPVSVASASCYTTDPAAVGRFVSGVDAHQSFNMLHVYDDRVVHTLVPLADAAEVNGAPADVVEFLGLLTPEERREIVSRQDSDFNRGKRPLD